MISTAFDKDVFKILTVFSLSPGSRFNRKELKEKTKMNNKPLDETLTNMLNAGILKKEKRNISLNIEDEKVKNALELVSSEHKKLRKIPLDAYFSIIDITGILVKHKELEVYLFGSYAKIVYTENSDIDIAVISGKNGNDEKKDFGRQSEAIEKRYGKELQIHYFGPEFHKNRKDPLVKEILKNGIRLI